MHQLIEQMYSIAKKSPKKIIVCEGWDERTIQATAEIIKEKLAQIILVGNPAEIKEKAAKLKADLSGIAVIDHRTDPIRKELIAKLVEVRQHKGMTEAEATKLIDDVNYFGVMYTYCGHADGVASSTICPTAAIMRPALQILKRKDRIATQMGVDYFPKIGRVLWAADISLNITPSSEDLAQICMNVVEVMKVFQVTPKVAFLSYSTKGSGGEGEDLKLIRNAVDIVKKNDPTLLVDGELQADAALSVDAAKRKCPDSPLKGEANVLILPNLMTANVLYHSLIRLAEKEELLGMVAGTTKPVAILGRSSRPDMIKNYIVCAALQANIK